MEVYVVVTCLGVGCVEGMIWVGGERYTLRKISIENNREIWYLSMIPKYLGQSPSLDSTSAQLTRFCPTWDPLH